MTNVQADIQVDAGNNAWLLTLPEVRIEGELFEECTVVALRTLKDSWYHPDGENYSGPRTLAGREMSDKSFLEWRRMGEGADVCCPLYVRSLGSHPGTGSHWTGFHTGKGNKGTRCWLMGNAAAYLLGKNSAGRDSSQEYMDFP